MLPIFKLILLFLLAAIAVVAAIALTEPMYLLAALGFNPASLLIVFGFSIVVCVFLRIESWLLSLATIAGVSALFVATAYAATFALRPCQRLMSIDLSQDAIEPFRVTEIILRQPKFREDTRIQQISSGSERTEERGSDFLVKSDLLRARGINGTDARENPDCAFALVPKSVTFGSLRQRHRGVDGLSAEQHCLSAAEKDLVLTGLRYEVTQVVTPRTRRREFIARAFDKETDRVAAKIVFFWTQPTWYGFPFNAYQPLSCADSGLTWDDKPFLGLQPMPPREPALALAAGLKAVYERPD